MAKPALSNTIKERRRATANRLSAKAGHDLLPIESLGLVGTSLMSQASLSRADAGAEFGQAASPDLL